MSSTWTSKLFSKTSSASFEIDESLLDEQVVLLMQGNNNFGDRVYSYLQLTLRNLKELKIAVDKGGNFSPSDFGTVLAAGRGDPSAELRAEMAVTYNMWDVPAPPPPNFAQPKVWGED